MLCTSVIRTQSLMTHFNIFQIISNDGQSVVILSSSTEDQASDWIMKLCQIVAGSSEFFYTTLCPAARAIPCCTAVTKEHIVTFHAHINGEYRFLSSFFIQDITQILVDNEVRNYCVLVSIHRFFLVLFLS